MALDLSLSALGDPTWEELKRAAKYAMVTAALGGNNLTINGRTVGRVTIDQAKTLYDFAVEQIVAESAGANGSGNVLVEFRDLS
jgi:hypothetical protein